MMLCWLWTTELAAQDTIPARIPGAKIANWALRKLEGRVTPVPVIYYTPETSLGLGAMALTTFRAGRADSLTRVSNVQAYAVYTLNRQANIASKWVIFTGRDRYLLRGNVSYFKFPEYFYGMGDANPQDRRELISYEMLRIEQRLLRRLGKSLYVGPDYRYFAMSDVVRPAGGLMDTLRVPGYQGSVVSGLGAALLWDSRDNILNPYRGSYAELSGQWYDQALQSQFAYRRIVADVRTYVQTGPRHVFALQGYLLWTDGQAPFRQIGEFGNDMIMRGYYRGRFRDASLAAVQAEYRFPVWWRFGAVVFGGAGNVFGERAWDFSRLKPNAGVGLRFLARSRDRLQVRIDYGIGADGARGFYLELGEAF